jgi:hypothetical protein
VHHETVLRVAFADRNVPGLRRRFEHLPRGSAGDPHRPKIATVLRPVGVLVAVFRRPVPDDLNATPVGLELIGQHQRQSVLDAGASGAAGDDRHEAGIIKGQKGIGLKRRYFGRLGKGELAKPDMKAENEPRGGGGAFEYIAPAEIGDDSHPTDSAADLMACRMRR